MFTDISLCPGGAFMMHESVAEFDSNIPVNPAHQEEMNTAIAAQLREQGSGYCPISKAMLRITPLYDQVKSLLLTNLRPATVEEAVSSLDTISSTATEIAESLRMALIKQDAVYRYISEINENWAYEAIHEHLGFFIKNYNRLISLGYGKVSVTGDDFPVLDIYNVNRAIALHITSTDALPTFPFDISKMYSLTNYDKSMNVFSTTEDMFDCMINDPERRIRLSASRVINHDLEMLITRFRDNRCCDAVRDYDRVVPEIIAYMSRIMRLVKCGCYELQCDLMNDTDMDPGRIHNRMRPLIAGTADLLYIPALKMISNAYRMKVLVATKDAINDFVDQALSAMKTPG